MIDFTVACDKLAQFESEFELALFLKDEGIKGLRQAHSYCPIANWVKLQTGEDVSVTGRNVWCFTNPCMSDHKDRKYEASDAMNAFVNRFDAGEFGYLEGLM